RAGRRGASRDDGCPAGAPGVRAELVGPTHSFAARAAAARRGAGRVTIGLQGSTKGGSMLITTANDLPGYEITETLGEVFGLTVRSRNVGSQFGAGLKSIMGGELKGMTKALTDSREQVIARMVDEAQAKGADAVVAMRFDTSEMGNTWTEICAYGTAVKARKA